MKGNKKEWRDEENRLTRCSSSFRVSELLLAIENLSKQRLESQSEQNHVEKLTEAERLQLPTVDIPTANDNQGIKNAKLPDYKHIRSGSSKRIKFELCPQQSIFGCNMDAKSLQCKMDTKPQDSRKSKLVCNWPKKAKLDNQFDQRINAPQKKLLISNVSGKEYTLPSLLIPQRDRKRRPLIDKTSQARSPFLKIKPSLCPPRIQRSVLTGTQHYESFLDLKDLQWKLYKGAAKNRAPDLIKDERKCTLQPTLIGRQHEGTLPVPLICKGNKYIEMF
ncbi:uncharacterized protein [Heptranchias perlo]|uniref:uncharacterized protein isoform X2 n=1 Tax=Heptranchias perlo TaxID=212740 RepID=UPI0035593CB6